jgi:hypothetical protein
MTPGWPRLDGDIAPSRGRGNIDAVALHEPADRDEDDQVAEFLIWWRDRPQLLPITAWSTFRRERFEQDQAARTPVNA